MSDTLFKCDKCGPDADPPPEYGIDHLKDGLINVRCHGEEEFLPAGYVRTKAKGSHRVLCFAQAPGAAEYSRRRAI